MAFDDIYPEGRQSGVSIVMHGNRVAANGDIRFEQTPGQWQPVPKLLRRELDDAANAIAAHLAYPDLSKHLKGMNPAIYPDFEFDYAVTVKACGESVIVTADLSAPVPERFVGKLCFNLELYPGDLFGQPWIMDGKQGIFPPQPNGPIISQPSNLPHTLKIQQEGIVADIGRLSGDSASEWHHGCEPTGQHNGQPNNEHGGETSRQYGASSASPYNPIVADDYAALPYATGKRFTMRPDDPYTRLTIESNTSPLNLYDGRLNHNNGWFVLSAAIPANTTKNAVHWIISPNAVAGWRRAPVIQASQVGYHPDQPKTAIIELDRRDPARETPTLHKITETGPQPALSAAAEEWGPFLRYSYLKFDFSAIKDEGLYQIQYGASRSPIFRIAADIYDRGVWQPVLEYFLPVQMCHMRVNEKYRVWHGLCHSDDARMAPCSLNHFDGYIQGPSTLTAYKPGEHVPGLDAGGWHDAGDYDLRVESQTGEMYVLSLAYESFGVCHDATTIDQRTRTVEIHQPDGKNDILQQIEHGALSAVSAYYALGRLYRGIICASLRQYVHLGDSAVMTDGVESGDDRLVFTEDNPPRELTCAAHLAAASRALRGFNDGLANKALNAAREIFATTDSRDDIWRSRIQAAASADPTDPAKPAPASLPSASAQAASLIPPAPPGMEGLDRTRAAKIHAAAELFLATGEQAYRDFLLYEADFIAGAIKWTGWIAARADKALGDPSFTQALQPALLSLKAQLAAQSAETPYGVPYRPRIWGAGWEIQRLGFQYYFLHAAYPGIFGPDLILNALNFVLGCHPGANSASFASGVGAKSATAAYGQNRADWSYIPGGVVSGTALIRPDFPELKDFPFLWQQTEYVIGGGSSCFMFLVLAARHILALHKSVAQ
nr:Glycoside hydrolase, family 9 [uncultured bacterium]